MNNTLDALKEFGLDKNQASVYLALLSNQDSPAYKISQVTNIPRTTVYKALEALKHLNLASSWIKNGVKHFSAENPEFLRAELKRKEEKIKNVLPELLDVFNLRASQPSAKLYEGKAGLEKVFDEILRIAEDRKVKRIIGITDRNITEQIPEYYSKWKAKKNRLGISSQLIVPQGTPMDENYKSYELRETRILPESLVFEGGLDIVGSFIAFFSFKNGQLYAVTIDSPIIANIIMSLFNYMWVDLGEK